MPTGKHLEDTFWAKSLGGPSSVVFWLQEEGNVFLLVMSNWASHTRQFQEQLSTMVLKLKGDPLRLSLNINTLKHFLLNASNFLTISLQPSLCIVMISVSKHFEL